MSFLNTQDTVPAAIFNKNSIEQLATAHFERIYLMVNAFYPDPVDAIRWSEEIFRRTSAEDHPNSLMLYQQATDFLTGVSAEELPFEGISLDATLSWMLKDFGLLRYHEIASLQGLDSHQVKKGIAQVRFHMMGKSI